MILGLFKKNPQRESRRLSKDAASIVEFARVTYRTEILREIASLTREGIAQIDALGDDALGDAGPARRKQEIDRFKALHRDARRRQDQAGLTAYTLVIIHAMSLEYGHTSAPAREAIQDYLADWPADQQEPGTLEI